MCKASIYAALTELKKDGELYSINIAFLWNSRVLVVAEALLRQMVLIRPDSNAKLTLIVRFLTASVKSVQFTLNFTIISTSTIL